MATLEPIVTTTAPALQTPDESLHENTQWLRHLPKAELHLHLEGTITPSTLVQLSQRHDPQPLTLAQATALYTYTDFLHFLATFKTICAYLRTPQDYELIVHQMIHDLAAQGVSHAEVYIAIGGLLKNRSYLLADQVFAAVEKARVQAEAEFGVTILWIVDATRQFGADAVRQVFSVAAEFRALYPSIVGVGIGGDEVAAPCALFREVYAEARQRGLRLTAHAGESTGAVQGPRNIRDALAMGVERIGHGMCAVYDEELMSVLREKQTPMEVSVTSNVCTGVCGSVEAHPIRRMREGGLMVTVNSDDPAMFGSHVLSEYGVVQGLLGASREEMKGLARNSIRASFLSETRKLELLKSIDDYQV